MQNMKINAKYEDKCETFLKILNILIILQKPIFGHILNLFLLNSELQMITKGKQNNTFLGT